MRKDWKKGSIRALLFVLMLFICTHTFAQVNLGKVSGSFQTDAQYYFEDSVIGAPEFPEGMGANSFLNLIYTNGDFSAGMRVESYMPTLQGYLRETGTGIPYRYGRYSGNKIDVTLGHFYEQFGSGMIFRSYEAWGLGYDSAIDGARIKFTPVDGIDLIALAGRQRNAFSFDNSNLSDGLVRGADANFDLNQLIPGFDTAKTRITVGSGFVSRYQSDEDPVYILPENVAAYSARTNVMYGNFSAGVEYASKINDPSTVNNLIYKPGSGVLVQASYSQRGLGVNLMAKRIDNMDYRSERSATFNNLNLNYLPPISKQHTYRLVTLFPWATQPMGEIGFSAEAFYKIKKGSAIGGKYGTNITVNFSKIHGLKKTVASDPDMGYESEPFALGDLYFQDINFEISRKFNKKLKGAFSTYFITYDKDLFKQLTGFNTSEKVHAMVNVLDVSYKIKKKRTIRTELQHCQTQQEFGSWAMLLAEYSIAPKFFIAAFDEYNYGNADPDLRLHYFSGNFGYIHGQYRITVGYGRQRAGVLCVGGVCRVVPASNGFSLAVSGSF